MKHALLVAGLVAWAFAVAFAFGACMPAAAPGPPNPACSDAALDAIKAQCLELEAVLGCADDPERDCPEVVAECDARIDAWVVCE